MATVLDHYRIRLDLSPRPKKVLNLKCVNLELPPPARGSSTGTQSSENYDSLTEDSEEDELLFSEDDEADDRRQILQSAVLRQQATAASRRYLRTAIGDTLHLSSQDCRNGSDFSGRKSSARWTTSAGSKRHVSCDPNPRWRFLHSAPVKRHMKISYLVVDGSVHKHPPLANRSSMPNIRQVSTVRSQTVNDIIITSERAWGLKEETRSSKLGSRSSGKESKKLHRRPQTVTPRVPPATPLTAAEYVTERVRYLLEARASINPQILKEEILPLFAELTDPRLNIEGQSLKGDMILPNKTVLTGKECRKFRKRVLNYIRQRRVIRSFQLSTQHQALLKFKTMARVVVTLAKMLKAIITNAEDLTTKSAAEMQWQALYSDKDPHKLAFNASIFTRERAIEKLPMWSIDILRKEPTVRDNADCWKLHTLLKGLRCFDRFTEKIQYALCKTFKYECLQEGRVILRQGHVGQNFYIIYSGSVFVNVNETSSKGKTFAKTEAILSKGDSFGELALLQDIRRTATIIVRETCELLVVEKPVFSSVCPRIFEIELEEKQQFMEINRVIVQDSVREEWIYVCIEGKCQVIRCLELNPRREPRTLARRRSTVLLSDEILDLLGSFPDTSNSEPAQKVNVSSASTKEKLLSSLGLDYLKTGKRQKTFIHEMEEVEKKKVMDAVRGHMTLTSFMKDKLQKTPSDLVFLHVAELNANEIFDLSCVLNPYHRLGNSPFLLVSGGARMLRIRRDHFHDHASNSALEYAKTQAYKERYPSDEVLLRSYKDHSYWDAFKGSVVRDVKSADPILKDRKRFYKRQEQVNNSQNQIWTFLVDSRVIQLKSLPRLPTDRPEQSEAVARAWASDPRPEVVRTVPENMVLRRRSSVRFIPGMPVVQRKSQRTSTISEDTSEEERTDTDRGKHVSIKLPSDNDTDD